MHDPTVEFAALSDVTIRAARRTVKKGRMRRFYSDSDAAQEALLKLWQSCQEGPMDPRKAFLMAQRAAIDGYRRTVGRPGHGHTPRRHAAHVGQVGLSSDDDRVESNDSPAVDAADQVGIILARMPAKVALFAWLRLALGWSRASACAVAAVSLTTGDKWLAELTRLQE